MVFQLYQWSFIYLFIILLVNTISVVAIISFKCI